MYNNYNYTVCRDCIVGSRSVCVCLRLLRAGYEAAYERYIPTVSVLQGQEKECGDFVETTAFERYGVKTSEKANMHNEHWLTSTSFSPFSAPWTKNVPKGMCIQVQIATSLGRGPRCVHAAPGAPAHQLAGRGAHA